MKSLIIRMLLYNVLVTAVIYPCPTYMGRFDDDTPPLFSKEYEKLYALHDDGTFDLPLAEESVDEIS